MVTSGVCPEDTNRKRTTNRIVFRYTVRYGPRKPPEFVSFVTNLSDTGLCIKTNNVFSPGTHIYMVIELPGNLSFNAEGTVMWAKKAPPGLVRHVKNGMGIKFTQVDDGLLTIYRTKKGRVERP
ncbi:MAG: PilZ domain-containing protein [Deltaproteobacteria bacterium]|nr:PilZ domain-containing protein [Deltaproteobacteria bacterium]